MYRDINWSVTFELTVNGEEVDFWELTDNERAEILRAIADDSYSGTFANWEE